MPIRLHDTTTEHEYSPQEGVVFRYRHVKSGSVIRALRQTRGKDGEVQFDRAELALVAEHLVDVVGVEDAEGKPLAWTAASPAGRLLIVESLPWDLVVALMSKVGVVAAEATASGKG